MRKKTSKKSKKYIDENGAIVYFYLNDNRERVYHRKNGPAFEWRHNREWFIHGARHREDGPAIECDDGGKHWYINGKCHREDGPAVEWFNSDKFWYIRGKFLSFSEFIDRLDDDDPKKSLLVLKYGHLI